MSVFLIEDKNDPTKYDETIKLFGQGFMVTFLLVNVVILLNFVIAILGSTYMNFEHQI